MMIQMPRYTQWKPAANGRTAFYWSCPTAYREAGYPYKSAKLGVSLSQAELDAAAKVWNDRLDAWRADRNSPVEHVDRRYGTIDWLVDRYQKHDSFLERVAEFSRPDYRRVLTRVCDTEITSETSGATARVGDLFIGQIAVSHAEKIYHTFDDGGASRTAEKVHSYCKSMWKRMRPHHPELFRSDTPNPWEGVTLRRREKAVKGHVDRAATYSFAWGAIEKGAPELAAAAVLAYEFFLRPSNIGAGWAAWSGYRGAAHPTSIAFRHRKNRQNAIHPLEFVEADGAVVKLYAEAESVLAKVPRWGTSIVAKADGTLYGDGTYLSKRVREVADELGMPAFTLDAARHGGLTELEEAGLTEGQGRVLSKHKTGKSYRGYAKETEKRVLLATKQRFGLSEKVEKPSEISGRKLEREA